MKNGRVGVIVLHEVSSEQARLLGMLFPHLDGLEFVGVRAEDAGLVVVARTAPEPVACRERSGRAGGLGYRHHRRRPEQCRTQISEPPEEASRTGAEDPLTSAEASAQLHNFIPYLRKRILDDRCVNAALLFQELREHGYQGSARTLRRYLVPFRDELAARKLPSVPLSGPSTVSVADRTRQRHAEIHALLAQGFNQTQICQITGLSEQTVKKFRRAATADELLGDPGNQYRLFERFVPYLRKRVIEDGCDNAALLCRELRDQGYRGSTRTIRRYLIPLRAGLHGPDLPPKPPSVRDVRRWITSDPDHLTDDDKDHLAAILHRSQPLAALDQHVTTFAKMLIHRTGERDLDDWLTAVDTETTDLPHLRSFAQDLRRDHTAVLNGLSLPYSSGAVEGKTARSSTSRESCSAAPTSTSSEP